MGPKSRRRSEESRVNRRLIQFAPLFLTQTLSRKRFLGPASFSGLHVKAVLLDFLDDVFLLHLALKASQGVLQGLCLLDDDFGHSVSPPIRSGLVSFGLAIADFGTTTASAHYRTRLLASSNQSGQSKSRSLCARARRPGYAAPLI